MADDNAEDYLFADEDDETVTDGREPALGWKILIVDDDPGVHAVTRLALADVRFAGRGVHFLSAYSAAQALAILRDEPDVAVVLLDVVMESEDAGLRAVRCIRDELGNRRVRLILRTGQPGRAPEREVILNYDINDYKLKTELTSHYLFTALIAALRSYTDILSLETSSQGLQRIIETSASLFEKRGMDQFISGALAELRLLIGEADGILLCKVLPSRDRRRLDFRTMAAAGDIAAVSGHAIETVLPSPVCRSIRASYDARSNLYGDDHCALTFRSRYHAGTVIYMRGHPPLDDAQRNLLEVFCSTLAAGFDNAALYEQLTNAQKATVLVLADLAEFRDEDTGEHVRRIERLTTAIARRLREQGCYPEDVDDLFVEQIGLASILHDVGKIGIPDAILRKPARLDEEEWNVMKTHAGLGGHILAKAAQLVEGPTYLSMAAEIAACHHEKYDGSGYPCGMRRDEIPLSARITAVADVYDALASRRPYKEPWPREKVLATLRDQSGAHFDPLVVEALFSALAAGALE